MASKTTRRSVNMSQEARSPSPQVSTSSGERRRSHLSPTRITRVQEKAELQNLNDRLANYIDTVRNLENENVRLNTLIRTTQETTTKEVTSVKSIYERELSDVRKALDATAKEKAKLQLLQDKWKNEAEDLRSKFSKKEKDLANSEKQAKTLDILNQDQQRRLSQITAENRKLEGQLREAESEISDLNKKHATMKKNLDDETLARVDLENRLQSAKEELSFKESNYQREISETRRLKETEVTQLNAQISERYEQKLADNLGELREQYETQLRMNKDEIETIYETKIADLQKKLERTSEFSNGYRDELRSLKNKVDTLSSKNSTLETQSLSLMNRIKDLEKMLEQERDWHADALRAKEDELNILRNEMNQQLSEYRDLLDIKVALDMEITAYRKLLEGEEVRLNISPSSSRASSPQPSRSTPARSTKRRRILTESEKTSSGIQTSAQASGDIDISEHDMDGKFVKIYNKGKQEMSLAGWHLQQTSEGTEVTYKLPRAAVIKPDMHITIWSFNSGMATNPPVSFVMKNQSWCSSGSITTTLLSNTNEEMARRESVKLCESSEVFHLEE